MREYPILCCDVSFFGTPTGPTQTSLFRYVNSRSMFKVRAKKKKKKKKKKNNIIHFHLKIELLAWEYKPYASSILKI